MWVTWTCVFNWRGVGRLQWRTQPCAACASRLLLSACTPALESCGPGSWRGAEAPTSCAQCRPQSAPSGLGERKEKRGREREKQWAITLTTTWRELRKQKCQSAHGKPFTEATGDWTWVEGRWREDSATQLWFHQNKVQYRRRRYGFFPAANRHWLSSPKWASNPAWETNGRLLTHVWWVVVRVGREGEASVDLHAADSRGFESH